MGMKSDYTKNSKESISALTEKRELNVTRFYDQHLGRL